MSTWTPTEANPTVYARLSGDHNPVHLDADHARAAGFERNIIHGMNTLGAAARAAHAAAPAGSRMWSLDVRFAAAVLPDQTVAFAPATKDQGEAVKVSLETTLPDGGRVMRPANFVFGPRDGAPEVDPKLDLAESEQDRVGDVFSFNDAEIAEYKAVTQPTDVAGDEAVPEMVGMLGMTGALEKAFSEVEPEKPGTWIHLRQGGRFYAPIQADVAYRCRILAGQMKNRLGKDGALLTIPFVVETAEGRDVVATGSCGLLYAFDKEA